MISLRAHTAIYLHKNIERSTSLSMPIITKTIVNRDLLLWCFIYIKRHIGNITKSCAHAHSRALRSQCFTLFICHHQRRPTSIKYIMYVHGIRTYKKAHITQQNNSKLNIMVEYYIVCLYI